MIHECLMEREMLWFPKKSCWGSSLLSLISVDAINSNSE